MATMTKTAMNAVQEYTEPAVEAVEETVRDARRAMVSGRHAVEDYVSDATLQVRRHPFKAVAIAAAVASIFGCVVGFGLGRRTGRFMLK